MPNFTVIINLKKIKMKFLKLSFFVALIFTFAACDTTDNCVQADWVGTYTATQSCDGGTADDATVTITASGSDAIIIETVIADSSGSLTTTTDPIVFDGCAFSVSASQGGVTLVSTGTLDGDNLTLTDTYSGSGSSTVCTTSATRN